MKINIPENIDLHHPEHYVLMIGLNPEQFSFSLHNPDDPNSGFYYCIPQRERYNAFSDFKEVLFENEFFTYPFRRVVVINYTLVVTLVPAILFEEKETKTYIDFLFSKENEKIVYRHLKELDLMILHSIREDIYEFFGRSFVTMDIIHYYAPWISYLHKNKECFSGKRMIIDVHPGGINIFCFDQDQLLLVNHFSISSEQEAVYYILIVWKQLKYNQLTDRLYLVGEDKILSEELGKYIKNLALWEPVDLFHFEHSGENMLFELTASTLAEL